MISARWLTHLLTNLTGEVESTPDLSQTYAIPAHMNIHGVIVCCTKQTATQTTHKLQHHTETRQQQTIQKTTLQVNINGITNRNILTSSQCKKENSPQHPKHHTFIHTERVGKLGKGYSLTLNTTSLT